MELPNYFVNSYWDARPVRVTGSNGQLKWKPHTRAKHIRRLERGDAVKKRESSLRAPEVVQTPPDGSAFLIKSTRFLHSFCSPDMLRNKSEGHRPSRCSSAGAFLK